MCSCVPFVASQVQKELDRFVPLPSLPPSVSTQCRLQCRAVQGVAFFLQQPLVLPSWHLPSKLGFQFASDMTISPKL